MQPWELPMKQRAWTPAATLPIICAQQGIAFALWMHLALPKCCGLLAPGEGVFWGVSAHHTTF